MDRDDFSLQNTKSEALLKNILEGFGVLISQTLQNISCEGSTHG